MDASDEYVLSSSEDEDDQHGTMLLPLYNDRRGNANTNTRNAPPKSDRIRVGNVWDEREELLPENDSGPTSDSCKAG